MKPFFAFLLASTAIPTGSLVLHAEGSSGVAGKAETATVDEISKLRAKAESGDGDAQCYLGMLYETGRGVPKDRAEAVKWFRKAADQDRAGDIVEEHLGEV